MPKGEKELQNMTKKTLVKESRKILNTLTKLQARINKLTDFESNDWYITNLVNTLQDLQNFDLEDAILTAEEYDG